MSFKIDFRVTDDAGSESATAVYVPDTFAKSDYEEFATTQATLLDAILAGRVVDAKLCIEIDLGGLAGNTASTDSDVEEVGAFVFDSVNQNPVDINLPTFDESKIIAGTRQIDTADTDVVAFVTALEAGVTAASTNIVQPTDIAEDDIFQLLEASEESRNSGSYR